MHEFSLMKGIVESAAKTAAKSPGAVVRELVLRIGALDIHSSESFKQSYEVLVKGTPMEGSKLSLVVEPARIECPHCGHKGDCPDGAADGHDPVPATECPGCGQVVNVLGGRGIQNVDLVLEEPSGK